MKMATRSKLAVIDMGSKSRYAEQTPAKGGPQLVIYWPATGERQIASPAKLQAPRPQWRSMQTFHRTNQHTFAHASRSCDATISALREASIPEVCINDFVDASTSINNMLRCHSRF